MKNITQIKNNNNNVLSTCFIIIFGQVLGCEHICFVLPCYLFINYNIYIYTLASRQ